MKANIFYSWQSDSDSKTNRSLIKNCLEKAIKDISQSLPIVDAIRLDHDTKDVAGTPDIANSIYRKIDDCQIFIADVTYVGSIEEKGIPNPNVMVELGYALKSIGDENIILVMNINHGDPKTLKLPFDLAHKRWPIQYDVSLEETPEDLKRKKEGLAKIFKEAILAILNQESKKTPAFTRAQASSVFRKKPLTTHRVKIGTITIETICIDLLAKIILEETYKPDVMTFCYRVSNSFPFCPKCLRPMKELSAGWMADNAQIGYACERCGTSNNTREQDIVDEVRGEIRTKYDQYYGKYQEEINKLTSGDQSQYEIK